MAKKSSGKKRKSEVEVVEPGPAARAEELEEEQDGADSRRDRFVVLLRHGIAEDRDGSKPDEQRSLTKAGHARMKQISRGLAEVFPKADAIYSSPLLRCVQTSLWVAKGYKGKLTPQTREVLAPSGSPREVREFLGALPERRVILVGHEPNLTESLNELTRIGGSGSFDLKKGGCYGVRFREDGSTTLEWVLTPRVLRRLSN